MTLNLPGPLRGFLLVPVIAVIIGSWFILHWYIGDTIAEYAPEFEESGSDMAQLAVKWAPNDPLAHFTLGNSMEKNFSMNQIGDAVREYETAVSLAPNDYRYWMQLGRALEAAGRVDDSEKALRHAVALAPAYSFPRWYFGNLLLREGKQDDAFRELVQASQADPALLPQVFNLSWDLFGGDVDQIANATCPNIDTRAQLAVYLANRNEADSAIRIWQNLNLKERREKHDAAEMLKKSFFEAGRFHYVLNLMADLEENASLLPRPETFSNAGFENDSSSRKAGKFGWLINTSPDAQIAVDHTLGHNGRASLEIVFKSPRSIDTIEVSQLVIVEPDTQYRFECYARTLDLHTGSTPMILILDPADHSVLASSVPLPDGTNDWQAVTFDFKTRPRMEGVIIKLGRAPCGPDSVCPIFGTVWYDDFNLQRYSGAASAVRSDAETRAGSGTAGALR